MRDKDLSAGPVCRGFGRAGVLVCCLNQATKLARFLLKGKKGYKAVLKLGASTDTQDVTGKVIGQTVDVKVSEKELREAFAHFKGAIDQRPPIYSALKHKGKPLYELARSGRPVQKPNRYKDKSKQHFQTTTARRSCCCCRRF